MSGAAAAGSYATTVPADLREGRTGVPTIDAAVRQLYATGYLHNHARMWLASYAVHLRKVHWRAGADWMVGHLLDGDVPSNHLSWQWVAGTFSNKPYLFNADNVARYATGPAFAGWQARGTLIDQDYEALDRTARLDGDVGPERGEHAGIVEPLLWAAPLPAWVADSTKPLIAAALPKRREIELVTPWSLSTLALGAATHGAGHRCRLRRRRDEEGGVHPGRARLARTRRGLCLSGAHARLRRGARHARDLAPRVAPAAESRDALPLVQRVL